MADYFHTDDLNTLEWLSRVVQRAEVEGLSLRLKTDSNNCLMVKLGGGIWTAPIASTPDAYRDQPKAEQPDTDDGITCGDCGGQNGSHFLSCPVWPFNN